MLPKARSVLRDQWSTLTIAFDKGWIVINPPA